METHNINWYAIIAIVLAASLVVFAFAKPQVVSVNPFESTKTLDVSADGKISADADVADIFVTVETKAKTADDAQEQNAAIVNSLRLALHGTGLIKDVTTSSFNMYPNYNYDTGRAVTDGYLVTHSLKINTEKVAAVGKILDVATANGATTISYVSFSLSDSKVESLKKQALAIAAENVMSKAQSLATATKVVLGRPVKVTENSYYNQPTYYGANFAAKELAAPTQVIAGQVDVMATVSISYEIA